MDASSLLFGPKQLVSQKYLTQEETHETKLKASYAEHIKQGGTSRRYLDGDRGWITYFYDSQNRFHKSYGPSAEYEDGSYEYYKDGQRHRKDGPAIMMMPYEDEIDEEPREEYWLDGEWLTKEEHSKAKHRF